MCRFIMVTRAMVVASSAQNGTTQYNVAQCKTIQAIQYNNVQQLTIQCNTPPQIRVYYRRRTYTMNYQAIILCVRNQYHTTPYIITQYNAIQHTAITYTRVDQTKTDASIV